MLASMKPKQRQDYVAQHSDDINVVIMGKIVSDIANKLKVAQDGNQNGETSTVLEQTIAAIDPETQVQPQFQQQQAPQQQAPQQQAPQQQAPQQQAPQQAMPQPAMPQPAMPQQAMPQQQAPRVQPTRTAADGGYMDSRLPEEMGIGALPERSLSNMADGGIVGFAKGGDIQRFQVGGMPERLQDMKKRPDESGEDFARRVALARQALYQSQMFPTDEQKAVARQQALEKERAKNMAEAQKVDSMNLPAIPAGVGAYSRLTNTPETDISTPPAAALSPPPFAATPPAAGASSGVPPAAAGVSSGAPSAAPPSAKATGIQTLLTSPDLTPEAIAKMRADLTTAQPAVVDPLKDERQKIVDAEKASGLEELQQHRDRVSKQGDPYAKQEERANKQEASVAESAERNPYLALMEAGFAAMAGDSPYAMVNLGKGALAGTKTYREGLALIEKAKEKLTETRDRIDGLRLIRSDLNASEERTILNQNRKIALDGTRFMFEGLAKATGESKAQIEANLEILMKARAAKQLQEGENARAVFRDAGETARNTASNAAAGVRNAASISSAEKIAGMLPKEAQMAMVLGTGTTERERLESGLRKAKELDTDDSKTIIQEYTKHVTEARKAMVEPMTVEAFVAQTRMLINAVKNKSNPQDEALVNKYAPK